MSVTSLPTRPEPPSLGILDNEESEPIVPNIPSESLSLAFLPLSLFLSLPNSFLCCCFYSCTEMLFLLCMNFVIKSENIMFSISIPCYHKIKSSSLN